MRFRRATRRGLANSLALAPTGAWVGFEYAKISTKSTGTLETAGGNQEENGESGSKRPGLSTKSYFSAMSAVPGAGSKAQAAQVTTTENMARDAEQRLHAAGHAESEPARPRRRSNIMSA